MKLGPRALYLALALGLLAAPVIAEGQRSAKLPRIGVLRPGSPMGADPQLDALRQGLQELGYTPGHNILLETRYAEGKLDRLPGLAAELVRLNADVIVVSTGVAIRAVKEATTTIPIVMAVSRDPVADGFVASLARPGGNLTGLSTMAPELSGKRLQLLREALPKVSRPVAVLWNPAYTGMLASFREVEQAGPKLGVAVRSLEVRDPAQLEYAFTLMTKDPPDALLLLVDPLTFENRKRIVEFAGARRLPAIYETRDFVDVGGLMSYGPNLLGMWRRSAVYVDKILKGTRPADLPVEQPMRFEMLINMRTAKALGLTFPPSIMVRADQVIQ